jgi:splicing factor 1
VSAFLPFKRLLKPFAPFLVLHQQPRHIATMAWRNQGITGSNNIPLGRMRRFGADADRDEDNQAKHEQHNGFSNGDRDAKRGRSPERQPDGPRQRKKRNRWGDASENKAAGLMGLPTAIVANMTSEQLEAYTLHLRIEEISQKLKIDDVVPADGDRSPSPAPMYDNHGRRVNTREYRYRKKLEDERHKLIEKAMKIIPNYHPPQDYRRPTKTQEKVYVPVNDYPEINFSMIANPLTLLTKHVFLPIGLSSRCCLLATPHASSLTISGAALLRQTVLRDPYLIT